MKNSLIGIPDTYDEDSGPFIGKVEKSFYEWINCEEKFKFT